MLLRSPILCALMLVFCASTVQAGFTFSLGDGAARTGGSSGTVDLIATHDGEFETFALVRFNDQGTFSINVDSAFVTNVITNINTGIVFDTTGGEVVGSVSFEALPGTVLGIETISINNISATEFIPQVPPTAPPVPGGDILLNTGNLNLSAIPEPSSLALLAIAGIGVSCVRRRKT